MVGSWTGYHDTTDRFGDERHSDVGDEENSGNCPCPVAIVAAIQPGVGLSSLIPSFPATRRSLAYARAHATDAGFF